MHKITATQQPCRGAAQFLLCRNPTSHYFSHVTICVFSQQPRITTQCICRGRRPRRPDPRQPLSPCMACEKNTNLTPSSGLSRAPAPTMLKLHNFRTRANAVRPYRYSGKFLPPQNRSALCVSTLRLGLERRCRFYTPISLSSNI